MKEINAFILGLLSINDIAGDEEYPRNSSKTDLDNIASDWLAIGNDIRNAINEYGCAR